MIIIIKISIYNGIIHNELPESLS